MDWAQILVYILSIFFLVFLLFAIILIFLLIKVTRQIKSATTSAERTIHDIEDSVSTIRKTALPLIATRAIMGQMMKSAKSKKGDENKT